MDGSEDADARGGFSSAIAGRADQLDASAGAVDRYDRLAVEALLAETIKAAKLAKVIKSTSLKRVIVMERAGAHDADLRLLGRSLEHLVKAAARHGLTLRQNYDRETPRLAVQIGRYAYAEEDAVDLVFAHGPRDTGRRTATR